MHLAKKNIRRPSNRAKNNNNIVILYSYLRTSISILDMVHTILLPFSNVSNLYCHFELVRFRNKQPTNIKKKQIPYAFPR